MCQGNPTWGAPRIHGELLKLGINIAESSVSKYMVRRNKPPSKNWRTFPENHAQQLVSIDFFTVPTIPFQVLYVFLVLAHDRRRILHFNVTAHECQTVLSSGRRMFMGFDGILVRACDNIRMAGHPYTSFLSDYRGLCWQLSGGGSSPRQGFRIR